MQHLRVKNWQEFQHYGKRNPPWIKLHNEILHSRTWVTLDDASKALAIAIMLLASRMDNKIPFDAKYIQRVTYLQNTPDLDQLIEIDFLEVINTTTERETERERASEALACASKPDEPEKKKAARKTQLPKDWQPSERLIDYCRDKRPDLDPGVTFQDFRDYYHSHGRTMADWDLTAMRWVRNEKPRSRGSNGPVRETNDERRAREADEYRRTILAG